MSLRRKLERLASRPEAVGLDAPSGCFTLEREPFDPDGLDPTESTRGPARHESRPWPPGRFPWSRPPDTLPPGLPGEDEECPWDRAPLDPTDEDNALGFDGEVGLADGAKEINALGFDGEVGLADGAKEINALGLDGEVGLADGAKEINALGFDGGVGLADGSRAARLERLRRMIEGVAARQAVKARARAQRAEGGLPGHREVTPDGPLRRAVAYLPPDHCHGRVAVSRALRVCRLAVAGLALDPRLADVDMDGALFLDTETTGLGGGTGVVPFLVGLAWFEDGALVVEQLLLEELGEEAALLARVHERIERSSCVVTYNGKTYDWPLLEARAVLARRPPLPGRPHLDLLHCSRRVYKPRLRQVRLVDMEEQVLGMRRDRDLDGAEIPGQYWAYLREGRPELLAPIVEHNANDVAALAAILAVLAERYAELHREDDPRDQLARAKVGLRAADLAKAEIFARAAAEGGGRPSVTVEACELLFRARVRRGDLTGARSALELGIQAAGGDAHLAAPLHLELAKLLEHRLRRYEEARVHAERAACLEGPEASTKRVARLDRRRRTEPPFSKGRRKRAEGAGREDEGLSLLQERLRFEQLDGE